MNTPDAPPTVRIRTRMRLRGVVVAALTLGGVTFGLTGCGGPSAATLGAEACVHVQRSLTLYRQSLAATAPRSLSLAAQARTELARALRPASLAATSDGEWQALAATVSQSPQVPEGNLVKALTDECAASPAGPRS